MERAKCYIARSEDFAKAITDCGALRVIAVMSDASVHVTQLSGYITEVTRNGSAFLVKTSHMKGDHNVKVELI